MNNILKILFPDILFQPRDFTGNMYTKLRYGFGNANLKPCRCGRKVKLILEQDRMEVKCSCGSKMELPIGDAEVMKAMREIMIERWNRT